MFSDFGIPDGHSVLQLHCHEAAQFFVAHTRHGNRPTYHSVWARRFEEKRYVEICGEERTGLSGTELTLHHSKPLISINMMVHSPIEDVNGRVINGFNWNSVETFDLETGERVSKLDKLAGEGRTWVSDLFGWSRDSDMLLAKIGIEVSETTGSAWVEYWLCRLNARSGDYEKITRLDGVFV